MKHLACGSILAILILVGCAAPRAGTSPTRASTEQLRDMYLNRNGTVGSNITVRVWRYKIETATAAFSFCLNNNDLMNPCGASDEYRLPIERLISSTITSNFCPQGSVIWELVIDASR